MRSTRTSVKLPLSASGPHSRAIDEPLSATFTIASSCERRAGSASIAISAWSQKGTLDDCKGTCSERDVDTMERTFAIADVALVTGVIALAAAAVVYLVRD